MDDKEMDEFVQEYLAYLRYVRLPERLPSSREQMTAVMAELSARNAANPHTDATDDMFSFIHDEPNLAWLLLLCIAALAEEPELGILGAGDLEAFVHVNAQPFADQIEQAIRENSKIRKAFESVYIGSDTPAEIGRRFNTALRDSGVPEENIIDWWSESGDAV